MQTNFFLSNHEVNMEGKQEVVSNGVTVIISKVRSEIDHAIDKCLTCDVYTYRSDGSKYLTRAKRTPINKRGEKSELQRYKEERKGHKVHGKKNKGQKEGSRSKKETTVATPAQRRIKAKRDRAKQRKCVSSGES